MSTIWRLSAADRNTAEDKRLGDDGASAAGMRELGDGDDEVNREEKQFAHGAKDYHCGTSVQDCTGTAPPRYDLRIRTQQVDGSDSPATVSAPAKLVIVAN